MSLMNDQSPHSQLQLPQRIENERSHPCSITIQRRHTHQIVYLLSLCENSGISLVLTVQTTLRETLDELGHFLLLQETTIYIIVPDFPSLMVCKNSQVMSLKLCPFHWQLAYAVVLIKTDCCVWYKEPDNCKMEIECHSKDALHAHKHFIQHQFDLRDVFYVSTRIVVCNNPFY